METIVDHAIDWLEIIYTSAPLSIRFAYTYWIMLAGLYIFIGTYDSWHNMTPKRKVYRKNIPYSVYVPGVISLILYNITSNTEFHLDLDFGDLGTAATGIGFILLTAGLVVATWGRLTLNGIWGSDIYTYENGQKLITNRIYRYMRHPIYTGQMAMALGSFFVSDSWWILLFPIAVVPLDMRRAYNEDKHLSEIFGKQYQDYRNRTLAFLPWQPPKPDEAVPGNLKDD